MLRLLRFFPTRWWSLRAWKTWNEYIHWRKETYGVYFPDGQENPQALRAMWKQFPSYYRWLGEMDDLRHQKINSDPPPGRPT